MTGPGNRFRIAISRAQMEDLERIAAQATKAGKKAEFVRWLKELDFRLTHEANEWGESREWLPVLKLQVRVGTVGALTVHFGVNAVTYTVYTIRFHLRDVGW